MKIDMQKFASLKSEELCFLYCMMVSYGEMPEFDNTYQPPNNKNKNNKNRKNNNNYKKKKKKGPIRKKDNTKPDLYDFDDPLWKTCKDEKFLAYKITMEKINI